MEGSHHRTPLVGDPGANGHVPGLKEEEDEYDNRYIYIYYNIWPILKTFLLFKSLFRLPHAQNPELDCPCVLAFVDVFKDR